MISTEFRALSASGIQDEKDKPLKAFRHPGDAQCFVLELTHILICVNLSYPTYSRFAGQISLISLLPYCKEYQTAILGKKGDGG
jgi:hypothetical protein